MIENVEKNSIYDDSLKAFLSKLNYEQLEQLLCKQAKNNLKLKEYLSKLNREVSDLND